MAEITDARDAYLAARQRVEDTRLALGCAIRAARAQGVDQVDIAAKLNLTREQVRRYQDEYEKKAGLKQAKPRRAGT
ncbi:MAG TPA: helix-turn-helix domain-containing protein [Streptosporangiaceae bacterium]|nr:helix-turn-helix domain-containing protein [Streptosporangiaceae bacterium]